MDDYALTFGKVSTLIRTIVVTVITACVLAISFLGFVLASPRWRTSKDG
jgi:hypothetical protein